MLRTSRKIGIDANRPLVVGGPNTGALSPTVADSSIIADTGAGWVRINFVLGPWTDPQDTTLFQGRTWIEAYDEIVNGFLSQGLGVYGLVGHEAVKEDPGDRFRLPPEQLSPDRVWVAKEWIRKYVDTFVVIARHFADRVKTFESFNEPDDWRGADRNWIHPSWFAGMLHEIFTAVRRDPGLNGVKIVSGPLQGLEINHNAAAPYLGKTYQEGKSRFGWGQGTPFPFDGVGYHLYILEGFNPDWPEHEAAVRETYRQYMDSMLATIRTAEGREKPIYVSEIGWFSNGAIEEFQAQNLRLGLKLVADDSAVALGIWFCTQDFGGDADGKYYGLYRKGDLIPANRKPAYHAYRQVCQSLAQEEQSLFDNQTMINAIFAAARDLGQGGWDLVVKAGLSHLVFARQEPYSGPVVEDLPGLTDAEKAAIRRRLVELVPELKRQRGWTRSHLNMRQGPGTGHAVIRVLPPETEVEILAQEGDWLKVAALGETGYVHRDYILLEEELVPSGFLRLRAEIQEVPLPPPQEEQIAIEPDMDWAVQSLANTWNRAGGLLALVANELKIDPAAAVAVFVVESPRGQGFAQDGRMIIRFENQIFYDKWGQWNQAQYAAHFQFGAEKRWQGHRWRPSPDAAWREMHGSQESEWQVFEFARTLDDTAAKLSISMGAPQIMGFNHTALGYESVDEMFQAFSGSERAQIIGFFDFVKGPGTSSDRLRALQARDFETFAALYNGSGQVTVYNELLTQRYEAFRSLRAGEPIAPSVPALAEPRPELAAPASAPSPKPQETLAWADWRQRLEQGRAQMQATFDQTLQMMTALTKANLRFYWTLLAMAIIGFLAVIGALLAGGDLLSVLILALLSVIALALHFLLKPMQRLQREADLLTRLQLINNTYWAKIAALRPEPGVQEEMHRIHQEASRQMDEAIEKRR